MEIKDLYQAYHNYYFPIGKDKIVKDSLAALEKNKVIKSSLAKDSLITLPYMIAAISLGLGLIYGTYLLVGRFRKGRPDKDQSQVSGLTKRANSPESSSLFSVAKQIGPNLWQIKVLDQNRNGGQAHCGYHAFKNALAGLGWAYNNIEGRAQDKFTCMNFYKKVFQAVRPYAIRDDISIVELTRAFSILAETEDWKFIQQFSSNISMFNSENSFLTVGDVSALRSVSNLIRLQKNPQPGVHAFLFGSNEHWITLFREIDIEKNIKWYSTDSVNNNNDLFRPAIIQLEALMGDLNNKSKEMYEWVIGRTFRTRAAKFSEDGKISNEDHQQLISERENNLPRIKQATAFIKESGWENSEDPDIKLHIKNLEAVQKFYNDNP